MIKVVLLPMCQIQGQVIARAREMHLRTKGGRSLASSDCVNEGGDGVVVGVDGVGGCK